MLVTLFKRSTSFFVGSLIGKLLSLGVFILLARALHVDKFGAFTFFVTLQTIVTVIADFGLNQWYQKHVKPNQEVKTFQQVVSNRSVSLVISLLCIGPFFLYTRTFSPVITVIFLASLIPEAFLSIIDGYYLEKGESWKVAYKIPLKMFIVGIGYFIFRNMFTLEVATFLLLGSSVLSLILLFPWKTLNKWHFSFSHIQKTFSESSAYAFLIVTSFLYARGDSLVIQYTKGNIDQGIYGVAYRYLESLSLLPSAVAQNLFPMAAKKNSLTQKYVVQLVAINALVGFFVAIVTYLLADTLTVGLFGPSYFASAPLVKIFAAVIFFFFINAPLSTVVQSSTLVRKFLPFGVLNTLLNLLLNIYLVPRFGITAAAWTMLTTEVTGLVINLIFAKKVFSYGTK